MNEVLRAVWEYIYYNWETIVVMGIAYMYGKHEGRTAGQKEAGEEIKRLQGLVETMATAKSKWSFNPEEEMQAIRKG